MMFSNSLGDQGTCLSVRPAVAYINTLLRPSVAEHLAHPIAWIRFNLFVSMLNAAGVEADSFSDSTGKLSQVFT